MPGEQDAVPAESLADGRHGPGDVIESARPATTRLADPTVFDRGDRVPEVGECCGERPDVGPVIFEAPETAVDEDDQGPITPNVEHLIRVFAICEGAVRGGRGTGEYLSGIHG
jgi:hypothetical protein